jgi:hypothetical protein
MFEIFHETKRSSVIAMWQKNNEEGKVKGRSLHSLISKKGIKKKTKAVIECDCQH